jgi:leucyl aminopeptidase
MLLMKKDMAGAAHALAIARMIMEARLPINLRVIIPAVENLPSGSSLKPNDIIRTRSGMTVEVGNTDAEGRLILADALSYAVEQQPELILDFATLTGAARTALGPSIVALFANNQQLADNLMENMRREAEEVWQLPLHGAYAEFLESDVADISNIAKAENIGGGAILGALMLQKFVSPTIPWAHFDIMAYNNSSKPGKPKGGEADCIVGVFNYLTEKFKFH